MAIEIKPEHAAAMVRALGVSPTAESAAEDAKWTAAVMERAAGAFARLEFEAEPSGFTAAQRRAAP